ncbi:unnamed protein product [Schistocephalus solidus]|uniref:Secreted protein n=1 Tax=Schistocephalus solidus TaxID=70667 RepID=A0A183SXA1_SCHSO|nr:unnamed protein product [Schistocephalus solidus]
MGVWIFGSRWFTVVLCLAIFCLGLTLLGLGATWVTRYYGRVADGASPYPKSSSQPGRKSPHCGLIYM